MATEKTFTIEHNVSPRFQQAETVDVATVKAPSKKEAIAAWVFYLKTGIAPVGKEVIPIGIPNYDWNISWSAYIKG